jgi:hypothetical protein
VESEIIKLAYTFITYHMKNPSIYFLNILKILFNIFNNISEKSKLKVAHLGYKLKTPDRRR